MNEKETWIAGTKTVEDWKKLRKKLIENGSEKLWQQTYKDFFLKRINTRYFESICILKKNDNYIGVGFSIMTIISSLIEFLESTYQGLKYRYLKKSEYLKKHEYKESSKIFKSFLCNRHPFNLEFDETLAKEFYQNIRCGLLHEARTKNGWKIRALKNQGKLIDKDKKIIFRDNWKKAFTEFFDDYESKLKKDKELQEAFIRKFDSLCE